MNKIIIYTHDNKTGKPSAFDATWETFDQAKKAVKMFGETIDRIVVISNNEVTDRIQIR